MINYKKEDGNQEQLYFFKMAGAGPLPFPDKDRVIKLVTDLKAIH